MPPEAIPYVNMALNGVLGVAIGVLYAEIRTLRARLDLLLAERKR